MLAQSPVAGDTRVLREAATLAEAGYEVRVIGRDVPAGFVPPAGVTVESVAKARGLRSGDRPDRDPLPIRAARWLLLPEHRARVEAAWNDTARRLADANPVADVVHAHDFNTLELGAELADRWGARLVYDSHELWAGRPRVGRPTPVLTRRTRRREGALASGAAAVLTVGDGLAEILLGWYGLSNVRVVRNTFPRLEEPATALESPAGLIYAGRLAPDRELEVIAAASRRLALPVTLIGPADEGWLGEFDPGHAKVLPPAPIEEIDQLLAGAGLALVTHSDRWLNHRLALPNKLYHAVRVGIPVVATDVGELAREVRAYGLGTLYRPGDATALADAVDEAIRSYPRLCGAVAAAAGKLSWDRDAAILLEVYAGLAGT